MLEEPVVPCLCECACVHVLLSVDVVRMLNCLVPRLPRNMNMHMQEEPGIIST